MILDSQIIISKITTVIFRYNLSVFLFYAALFINCEIVFAKDLYTVQMLSSRTSDDIDLVLKQVSYLNNRRDHFWPYEESATSNLDLGFDVRRYSGQASGSHFTGHHIEGLLGWRYAESTYLAARFGIHRLESQDSGIDKELDTYELDGHFGLLDTLKLKLNIAEDYVYPSGLQPAGVREFLHAQKHLVRLEWNPIEVVRISGSSSVWDLSDSNTRRENKLALLYGISPGWPWIWAGISYEELKYDESKPDYWTPEIFRATGFIFESSFPVDPVLSAAVSASLSRIREDNNAYGTGNSLFVGLDYKIAPKNTIRIGYSRIFSKQEHSNWTENALNLSVNGNF